MHDCFFPSYQFTFNMEGKFLYTSVVICMIFWANISTCSFVCTLTSTSWCSCWLKASSRVLILRAFYTNSAKQLAKVCNRRHMGNLCDHVWSLDIGIMHVCDVSSSNCTAVNADAFAFHILDASQPNVSWDIVILMECMKQQWFTLVYMPDWTL